MDFNGAWDILKFIGDLALILGGGAASGLLATAAGVLVLWALFLLARLASSSIRSATRLLSPTPVLLTECRLTDRNVVQNGETFLVKDVMFKGVVTDKDLKALGFCVSIHDVTDPNAKDPVLASADAFQERKTFAYQDFNGSEAKVGKALGFKDWTTVGVVALPVLEGPYGGKRKLAVTFRVVNPANPPDIFLGAMVGERHPGLLREFTLHLEHEFKGRGYKELAALREESRRLAVRAALAIAMRDGALSDECGLRIKDYMTKVVAEALEAERPGLKTRMNEALQAAYADAGAGKLDLVALVARLNEIASPSLKRDAVELCLVVLAANRKASGDALRAVTKLARDLQLDSAEIEAMRDLAINSEGWMIDAFGVEAILGIEDDWPAQRKKARIADEYQKWNNRLSTLPEGPKRENAQRMLDALGKARIRHA